jgi:hypothetical protein
MKSRSDRPSQHLTFARESRPFILTEGSRAFSHPPGVRLRPHAGAFFNAMSEPRTRAVVFIDGSNWYHSLKNSGFGGSRSLNYAKLSRKLVGTRTWIGTRFYIGRVNRREASRQFDEQRRFVSRLIATDSKITVHFGRIETRSVESPCAVELRSYLGALSIRIPAPVYRDLQQLASVASSYIHVTAEFLNDCR